ncbi:MAG: hypothetical protein JWO33_2341 [Caulobacteraceae bacterium]|nr:hypothetical protein [Caulobacteraceae bacterium]
MAEFETQLSGLFQEETEIDSGLGERLARAALTRIDGEDRRRGLILTTALFTGVAAAGALVARSGAIEAVRDLFGQAMTHAPPLPAGTLLWPAAALAMGIYAAVSLRPSRTL